MLMGTTRDLWSVYLFTVQSDSSVGMATEPGLYGPGIESRWVGLDFPHPSQTGPGAHTAPIQSFLQHDSNLREPR